MRIKERIAHYMSYFPAVFFTFFFTILTTTFWASEESGDIALSIIRHIVLIMFLLVVVELIMFGLLIAWKKIKSWWTPNTITLPQKGDSNYDVQ